MPALEMAQDTGKLIQWFKKEGQEVSQGEPLMEIETDKVTVEIEAPASGRLANVKVAPGDEVPVGEVIALILAPGEEAPQPKEPPRETKAEALAGLRPALQVGGVVASPVAVRVADEHGIDLAAVKLEGGRVEKADVLAYVQKQATRRERRYGDYRLSPASPKARRIAREINLEVGGLQGSGPGGAVLVSDVMSILDQQDRLATPAAEASPLSNVWKVMTERVIQSWNNAPHFYLLREVNASRFIAWREYAQGQSDHKITYTDLLVKVVATALKSNPQANASWRDDQIFLNKDINVGLAVAVEAGLIVPVIFRAEALSLKEIAARRKDLVTRAQSGKLKPEDLRDGTFTISNLGMYDVDAFNAVINPPQAAILAVGRIAERVIPENGQPVVRPMMMLSLSCDHRVIDGARGAQFLRAVTELIEEPLGLL
jgi:pyruvate dehydrogenase E2 component (dihydrolipoamide acetyltransferase)